MKFRQWAAAALAVSMLPGSAAAAECSAADAGAYIYIGTGCDDAGGLLRDHLEVTLQESRDRGALDPDADTAAMAAELAAAILGADPEPADRDPVILAVHKTTGEAEVVFSGEAGLSGYRAAAEFRGKLYFAGGGTLVEVDPAEGQARTVWHGGGESGAAALDIRGLTVCGEELLMSLATADWDGKGNPGVRILASADPGGGADLWRVVGDQGDFDDLPAVGRADGLFGGGIWDMATYNGHVYAAVVTDRDIGGQLHKQGFALYRGTRQGDGSYTWTQVVGDQGTSGYPFGMGQAHAAACRLWVHDAYLYLGTCNDFLLDLAQIPETGDFEPLYRDLDHSVSLYRMDAGERFRLVGGKNDNPLFPDGPLGNLGAGLGDHSNQAVWAMGSGRGMYVGVCDAADLTCLFARVTGGQVAVTAQEEIAAHARTLEQALKDALRVADGYTAWFLEELLLPQSVTGLYQAIAGLAAEPSGKDPVPEYRARLAEFEALRAKTYALLGDLLVQWDFPAVYGQRTGQTAPDSPDDLRRAVRAEVDRLFDALDDILYDETLHHYIYYLGCDSYLRQGEPGLDLLASDDGIHFEALTRDGFGGEADRGLRGICTGQDGVFLVSGDPQWGIRLRRLSEEPAPTEAPEDPGEAQPAAEAWGIAAISAAALLRIPRRRF